MSVKQTLDGDASGAVTAVTNLQKAFDKLDKGIELTAKEAKALEGAVGRVVKANETPLETFNRKFSELDKLQKSGKLSADEHAKAIERLKTQFENAGKASDKAFGSLAASSIKNYLTGLVTVQTVLGGVREEIGNIVKAAEKATQAKLSVAGSEATLRENLTGASAADREKVLAGAQQIASDLKLDQAAVYQALASTYASAGNPEAALDITRTAGRLSRDPAKLQALAGGIADIRVASGIQSSEEALGFGLLAQAESRITDTGKFFESLSQVTAGVTAPNTGGTPQAAAALLAAISKGSADTTGEKSRTGAIGLAQKLDGFFDKRKGGENFNTDQEIQALLSNRDLAKQFMTANTFDAGTSGSISKLFLEDGATRDAYLRAYAGTGDPRIRVAKAREAFGFTHEGGIQRTASTEQAIGSTMERLRLWGDGELTEEKRSEMIDLQWRLHGGFRKSAEWDILSRTGYTMSRPEAIHHLQRLGSESEPMPWAFGADRGPERENTLLAIEGLLKELRTLQAQQLEETKKKTGPVFRPERQAK